jgi:hypothetical protein
MQEYDAPEVVAEYDDEIYDRLYSIDCTASAHQTMLKSRRKLVKKLCMDSSRESRDIIRVYGQQ